MGEIVLIVALVFGALGFVYWRVNKSNMVVPESAERVNTPEEIEQLALDPDYGFLNERHEL